MDHFRPLPGTTARPDNQGDTLMVETDRGLGLLILDRHQMSPPPEIMALALDKPARRFPGLARQPPLLLADPAEF